MAPGRWTPEQLIFEADDERDGHTIESRDICQ